MVMRLSEIRLKSKQEFKRLGIETIDADFILAEILTRPVTELFVDIELNDEQVDKINHAIKERKNGKPVTKIFNKAYFYGMTLYVDENVLSPRPETESLVDKVLDFISNKKLKCLDLCTGSGAIACAIKKNSNVEMYASDISEKALDIAKKNAQKYGLDINFIQSDMFDFVNNKFDVIVSNPPYIETDVCYTLDKEVKDYDPILALDGGLDGMDFYRTIANNMSYLKDDGALFLEIGYNQAEKIKKLFKDYAVEIVKDYNDLDRIAIIKEKICFQN